jgi:hypothetical protein
VPVWKRTWLQPAGNNAYSDELLVAATRILCLARMPNTLSDLCHDLPLG